MSRFYPFALSILVFVNSYLFAQSKNPIDSKSPNQRKRNKDSNQAKKVEYERAWRRRSGIYPTKAILKGIETNYSTARKHTTNTTISQIAIFHCRAYGAFEWIPTAI